MRANEIREKTSEQILSDIRDAQEELMNLRFQGVVGQQADVSLPKRLRRDIARMKTIVRERELREQ